MSTNVNPTSSWDEHKRDTRWWWDASIYRGNSGFCVMHTNAEGGKRERERETEIGYELVSSWSLVTRTPCEDATDRGDTRLISHATPCHDLIAGTRETTSAHVE